MTGGVTTDAGGRVVGLNLFRNGLTDPLHAGAARDVVGGVSAIEAIINLMVGDTNQAYVESGVHHRVKRSEVRYVETGDSRLDLRWPSGAIGRPSRRRLRAPDRRRIQRRGHGLSRGPFGLSLHNQIGAFADETRHNMGLRHDRYLAHYKGGGVAAVRSGAAT